MRLLFFHQNFPGQFRYLIRHFLQNGDHEIVFVTQKGKPSIPGVRKIEYEPHRDVSENIHPYLFQFERGLIYAQGVTRKLIELRQSGFRPDVMIGNPGWGETLFVKDVFPETPLISYCEFYYRGRGSDVGFDPEFASGLDGVVRARARAAMHLLALEASDYAYSPTNWQKSQFPSAYQDRIDVIHDGIDIDMVKPNPDARFTLPDGTELSVDDEVLTYVSRNLEPYRGFHSFMRALPAITAERPNARVVIVGGDGVSYGARPADAENWRTKLVEEVGALSERVHFVGKLPYQAYLSLLAISSVHVYLTYPFVLSWSMLEAMATGCVVLGSRTPPVEEVIQDGQNGFLVDFFDSAGLSRSVTQLLENTDDLNEIRERARDTVCSSYNLSMCIEQQVELIIKAKMDKYGDDSKGQMR